MMFTQWDPDVFIDTHTSNGADYQYVMTLITTQLDKLHPSLSSYVKDKMNPALYEAMEQNSYEMIPYVNSFGKTPVSGIVDFLETPRYSTGYTTLFNTISSRGLIPKAQGVVGFSYDDPNIVSESDLRSHAGVFMPDSETNTERSST